MPNPTIDNALGYIGFAKQGTGGGTQGTATAPSIFVPILSERHSRNPKATFYRTGLGQGYDYSVMNSYSDALTVQFPFTSDVGGQLLYAAMGNDVITGMGDPYTHTLAITNQVPWYSVERAFFNQGYIERMQDCKLDGFTLEGSAEGMVMMSVPVVASYSPKVSMAATVTFSADAPFMFRDSTFAINGVAAASVFTVQKVSVQFTRGIKTAFTTHVYPDFVQPTARELNVSIDVIYDATNAQTWLQAITKNASTTTPTKIPYSGALTWTIDPGASPDHSLVLTVADLRQITASTPIDVGAGFQMMTFSGKAQRAAFAPEFTAVVKSIFATSWAA